mgnify:CR=1 FL=1
MMPYSSLRTRCYTGDRSSTIETLTDTPNVAQEILKRRRLYQLIMERMMRENLSIRKITKGRGEIGGT